jgi:hypothetical protein
VPLEGRRCGGRPSVLPAGYGMIEANEVKKPATRPESIERTSTTAGVITARINEYSATVCPLSRRQSRKVFTLESSYRTRFSAIPRWGEGV